MTRYQEKGIIVKRKHTHPKPWTEIRLHEDYIPQRLNGVLTPHGHLWEMVERIGKFRREGKNRRDNATGKNQINSNQIDNNTYEVCTLMAIFFIYISHSEYKSITFGRYPWRR